MSSESRRPANGDRLHFGYFSSVPEYRQVNRELIRQLFARLPNPFVHVDVATGTGLVPQLVIEEAKARGYQGKVIGIDHNSTALELARAATPNDECISVEFIQGDAREIDVLVEGKIPPEGADSFSIHDAIHEIEGEDEQRRVYEGMARVARGRALLTTNSSFTTVSMDVGHSLRGHGEWKLHFVKLTNAKRDRSTETLVYRTPDEYKRMVRDAGFEIIHDEQKVVQLTKAALKAIAQYPEFVRGMAQDLTFPREFSLEELSEYMSAAVDKLRYDVLPRIWYGFVAQRPGSAPA
jgi:ubiquinone/menaquinone biosynthesis C-methylase UbiE